MVADNVWMGGDCTADKLGVPIPSLAPTLSFSPTFAFTNLREGWHKIDLALHSTGHFGDQVTSWGCDGGWMTLGLHCLGILHSDLLGVPSAAGDWMMRV